MHFWGGKLFRQQRQYIVFFYLEFRFDRFFKKVKSLWTDGRTDGQTDDRRSEKRTWALRSGELTRQINRPAGHLKGTGDLSIDVPVLTDQFNIKSSIIPISNNISTILQLEFSYSPVGITFRTVPLVCRKRDGPFDKTVQTRSPCHNLA